MKKGLHPFTNKTILINSLKGSYITESILNNKKIKYEFDQLTSSISNPLNKKKIIKENRQININKFFFK